MRVIWQSEIDPYAIAVLRKHWPHVPGYGDIHTIGHHHLEWPDVLCGGPPCQATSVAAAVHGRRTGASLWSEMLRLTNDMRPGWVVVEQPPGNAKWEASVASDLAGIGYETAKL